jgi:T5SS/PEP-CTERM-associated repeat protein
VAGAGSTWANSGALYVGGNGSGSGGSGSLTIGNGGTVSVGDVLKVWNTGSVDLNGGSLLVDSLDVDGTFNFNSGLLDVNQDLLLDASALGANFTLTGAHELDVGGTTTINAGSVLTLDGGTFSTGVISNGGTFDFVRGNFNLTNSDLVIGAGGPFGDTVGFNSQQHVNVSQSTAIASDGLLIIENGSLTSNDYANSGEVVMNGFAARARGNSFTNSGLLRGEGRVDATLSNQAGGEVRTVSGQRLLFTNSGNSNAGEINAYGGTVEFSQDLVNNNEINLLDGIVEVDQQLTNSAAGFISGHGTLVANGGLSNEGTMAFSGGSDVFGDVDNTANGRIVISGGSTATFYDDVVHNGSEIRVSSGSSAVFFGALSGAGAYTGTGTLFAEGDLDPGNSPGLINIQGNLSLGDTSNSLFEIGGTGRGTQYDAFDIGGYLSLGGTLDVGLYDFGSGPFSPQAGDSFDLFMADTISGSFDLLTLAALGGGLAWQFDFLADAVGTADVVRLSVVSAVPVPPALWLFGSGLLGLIGMARRKKVA